MGLSARRGRRLPRTNDSRHGLPVAPNLLARNFSAERPGEVWLADVSCIPTGEGFLYLAAAVDMGTREIVGRSMADHLRAGPCVAALVMAIRRHRPPRGLVHYGDRGVHFTSAERFCRAYDELRDFLRPRTRQSRHVPADHRRRLHLCRATAALAILGGA
jgi:putative transposase